ncbi:unnamed protein product, partial [Rotaria magnacalcarata]
RGVLAREREVVEDRICGSISFADGGVGRRKGGGGAAAAAAPRRINDIFDST